jgi:PhzF family phenazine biosynthesis protein
MRIRVIDAFTDEPFRGNPAAVCLLPEGDWPEEAWMQRVAAEMNLSETAFAKPRESDWDLRWFTPLTEVSMCGHATLATAYALAEDGAGGVPVRFHTLSGVLTATAEGDAIAMDFPASPVSAVDIPAGLAEALGCEVLGAYDTGPLGDLLVELPSAQHVRDLRPDQHQLLRYAPRCVIVTAEETAAENDFVSRVFCPAVGIPEDPVTGSAHTALGPFWAARLGRTSLVGVQASARSGRVLVEVRGDRVELRGRAVTMLDGRLVA